MKEEGISRGDNSIRFLSFVQDLKTDSNKLKIFKDKLTDKFNHHRT